MMDHEAIKRISHRDPETIEAFITSLIASFTAKVEQLEARMVELETRNHELETKNKELETKNKELERRLGQNSQNSNWPPSRDVKRPPANHRKKGGKKGGPVGHPGHTLFHREHPDEIITHPLTVCPDCATSLVDEKHEGYERRQVLDIPPSVLHTTEYRAEKKKCPCCNKLQKAAFPAGVNAYVQYGPRFQALVAYLHTYQLLPLARIADMLQVFAACRPSEATLLTSIQSVAGVLRPYETAIRAALLASPVIHADETGVHVNQKEHWVHVASTATWTLLNVHASRGSQGMKAAGVLPTFKGTVCHDFYSPYTKKGTDFIFSHAFCNAHLSRECKGIAESGEHRWARAIGHLLHRSWKVACNARKVEEPLSESTILLWERRYDRILEAGLTELAKEKEKNPPLPKGKRGKQAKSKAENLWIRFRDYKSNILGYLRHADLPFDNNQAERDLRMVAVKRKISGCFRSEDTPANFATLRSFISTLIKQGHSILPSLELAQLGLFSFKTQGAE